jgi:hypothetical protein
MQLSLEDSKKVSNRFAALPRWLSLPIFVGVVFFSLLTFVMILQLMEPKALDWKELLGAFVSLLITISLAGLAWSILRGRGVPRWFMRLFVIATIGGLLWPIGILLKDIWFGNNVRDPDEDSMFLLSFYLLVLSPNLVKTLWNHQSHTYIERNERS